MNILVQSNPISSEFIRTNKIQSFDSPHITVIECGQLIDGKSKVPIKDAIIVVADDRIAYVSSIILNHSIDFNIFNELL